jgi:NADPH:quinone reductase-like Zn-dependent oxidoreductase
LTTSRTQGSGTTSSSTFICSENAQDLIVLTELIESGTVTPVIDRAYPLTVAPAAHRRSREETEHELNDPHDHASPHT